MIKRLFFQITFLSLALNVPVYPAQNSPENQSSEKTVQAVLKQIRENHGISSDQPIDCNQVSDQEFEELGDALMGVMHPDPKQHQFMDRMMGGEGSPNLSLTHRMMGARYLGCYVPGGNMPASMGFGMMGGGMMGDFHRHMMDYGDGGPFMWILLLVIAVVVITLVVQNRRSAPHEVTHGASALDILKQRYAKGEITKEQFLERKNDLEG